VESGELDVEGYRDVAAQIVGQFPGIQKVAFTLRQSDSASHNNWGAMLYDAGEGRVDLSLMRGGEFRPYEIRNIVDRVGGGDSFAAGLIYALNDVELCAPAQALEFAVAASCLCHSIVGDINYTTRDEVLSLMRGSGSGRIVR
jgi:2-dehydro-3-deoxygluconokinase